MFASQNKFGVVVLLQPEKGWHRSANQSIAEPDRVTAAAQGTAFSYRIRFLGDVGPGSWPTHGVTIAAPEKHGVN